MTVYTAGAASTLLAGGSLGGVGATMSAGMTVLGGGAAAGAAAGGLMSATAAGFAGAAIGGAVGNIAGQGVAIASGLQDGFQWRQVGQAALGSAITADIGSAAQAGGTLSALNGSQAWQAAGRAALSSGANQALRGHWSWREIVASAVGGGAGAAAGNALNGSAIGNAMGSVGQRLAAGFAGGVAGQWAGPGGKANYGSVFASTLGNVIGDSITAGMSRPGYSDEEMAGDFQRENNRFAAAAADQGRLNAAGLPDGGPEDRPAAPDEYTGGRDFAAYLAGHRRVANEHAPAGAGSTLPGDLANGPMEEPPILGWMSSRSNRFDTRLPILGPSTLAKPDGSPGTYSFDRSTGEVYWDLGKENTVHAIPLAYQRPTWDEAVNDPSNPWTQGPRMGNVLADAALFTAGGVAGMLTGGWAFAAMRGAGYGLLGSGATAGVVGDLTAQAGDNLASLASDGQLGRSGINGTELAVSAGLGALPGLPVAVRGWADDLRGLGVPDRNIRFASRQPGVLYSNPWPFELVARESGPGLRAPFVDFDAVDSLAPGLYRADPQQLRFMQPTVSPNYSVGGHTIASTADDLRLGRVTPDGLGDPLRVVMIEGKPFSFDNRRLLSYSLADVREAPIQVMGLEDPAFARQVRARFNSIDGQGLKVVIATSGERPAVLADLYRQGKIQRPR